MLLILLKMVLMLLDTLGMVDPATIATKPAINAYSISSCPRVSFQILNFQTRLMIFFISWFLARCSANQTYHSKTVRGIRIITYFSALKRSTSVRARRFPDGTLARLKPKKGSRKSHTALGHSSLVCDTLRPLEVIMRFHKLISGPSSRQQLDRGGRSAKMTPEERAWIART